MGLLDRVLGRTFEALRDKGDRLFARGDPGLARIEYRAALRREGADERARAAVEERLRECGDRLLDRRLARAADMEALGHLEEADTTLREALELAGTGPRREEVFATLRRVEARQAGGEGEEDEPLAAEGDEFLGDSVGERFELHLLALDDEERAEEYRRLGPAFAEAYVAIEEGEGAGAVDSLETLLAEEDSPLVRRELGRALLLADRPADAIPHLRATVDAAPDDVSAVHSLAEALVAEEEVEAAVSLVRDTLEEDPAATSLRIMLGELLVAHDQAGEAADVLADGLEEEPRSIPLHRVLGIARAAAGDAEGAREAWEGALGLRWVLDNDTRELVFDRESAWLLAQLLLGSETDPNKALDLVSALAISAEVAERPGLLVAKARAHRLLGDAAAAREALVTARSLLPADEAEARARVDEALAELSSDGA